VAAPRELQRGLKGGDGSVEEPVLGVERSELVVILRELALEEEPAGLEVARARLGVSPVAFDVAADASPHVDVPRHVDRQDEIVEGAQMVVPERGGEGL